MLLIDWLIVWLAAWKQFSMTFLDHNNPIFLVDNKASSTYV